MSAHLERQPGRIRAAGRTPDQWNVKGLKSGSSAVRVEPDAGRHQGGRAQSPRAGEAIFNKLKEDYEGKEKILSSSTMRYTSGW